MAIYEPEAVFVAEPGQAVKGPDSIREVINGFLSMNGTLEHKGQTVFATGDIALIHGEWVLSHPDENGKTVDMPMRTSEVARRQPDGTWRYIIDNPFTP